MRQPSWSVDSVGIKLFNSQSTVLYFKQNIKDSNYVKLGTILKSYNEFSKKKLHLAPKIISGGTDARSG